MTNSHLSNDPPVCLSFRLLASPDHVEWPLGEIRSFHQTADLLHMDLDHLRSLTRESQVLVFDWFIFAILRPEDRRGLKLPLRWDTPQYPRFRVVAAPDTRRRIWKHNLSLNQTASLLGVDEGELERHCQGHGTIVAHGFVLKIIAPRSGSIKPLT